MGFFDRVPSAQCQVWLPGNTYRCRLRDTMLSIVSFSTLDSDRHLRAHVDTQTEYTGMRIYFPRRHVIYQVRRE